MKTALTNTAHIINRPFGHWLHFEKRNFFQIEHGTFLIGRDSSCTNMHLVPYIAYSKNNTEIFRSDIIRYRFYRLYSMTSWVIATSIETKPLIILFTSISPVFTGLLDWAAKNSNGISRTNRWLSGTVTAATKIEKFPNCLFIPDIYDNSMIVKEATIKKLPIIAIINSDSPYDVELGIPGNNFEYKTILQITRFLVYLARPPYSKALLVEDEIKIKY